MGALFVYCIAFGPSYTMDLDNVDINNDDYIIDVLFADDIRDDEVAGVLEAFPDNKNSFQVQLPNDIVHSS